MTSVHRMEDQSIEALFSGAASANLVHVTPLMSAMLAATCIVTAEQVIAADCGDAECEDCNDRRAAWWTMSNTMLRPDRVATHAMLNRAGIGLPEGPWELVEA